METFGDFVGDSEESVRQTIAGQYAIDASEVDRYDILAVGGDCGGYEEGHWFLLRRRADGLLMENEAGHCSCYDFEGLWGPTETSVAALLARKTITYHMPSHEAVRARAFIASLGAAAPEECATCGSPFCPGDEPHAFFSEGMLMTDEEMIEAARSALSSPAPTAEEG